MKSNIVKLIFILPLVLLFANCKKKDTTAACITNNTGTLVLYNPNAFAVTVDIGRNTSTDFTNPLTTFQVGASQSKAVDIAAGDREYRYAGNGDTAFYPLTLVGCDTTRDTTVFFFVSDRRLKTNIEPLTGSLNKIMQLQSYKFQYNQAGFPNMVFPNGVQNGFMAQEVECVLPELTKIGSNGYYTINYTGMIPVLTKALQEQQEEIKLLKEEVEQLKKAQRNKGI